MTNLGEFYLYLFEPIKETNKQTKQNKKNIVKNVF